MTLALLPAESPSQTGKPGWKKNQVKLMAVVNYKKLFESE